MPRWGFWARLRAQWKRDVKVAKAQHLSWRAGLGLIAGMLLLFLLLEYFVGPNLMQPAIVTLVSLLYVVWFKWELRRELWFRIVIGTILALHGMLLAAIPWKYRDLPGRAVSGACVLDICLIIALANAVQVLVKGKKTVANAKPAGTPKP